MEKSKNQLEQPNNIWRQLDNSPQNKGKYVKNGVSTFIFCYINLLLGNVNNDF